MKKIQDVKVKTPITAGRWGMAGGVLAGVSFGPQMMQPLIGYTFRFLSWRWPGIPIPDMIEQISMANFILGVGAALAILFFRSHDDLASLQARLEVLRSKSREVENDS